MIQKEHVKNNYVMIPREILMDKDLSLSELGLLMILYGLPAEWKLSINGLAKILSDGRDKIAHNLKLLEAKGYIVRTQRKDHTGKFGESVVILQGRPRHIEEKPDTTNPEAKKPYTENPAQ